ncbi:hypothetical protein SAMN04515671_1870 [Nakamurella panacisegetis]|uniref:Uncharacterized protein n=1 Tax=Nakamurella panacisegetis TaxID=1090615 RepID=A0A1H0LZG3_9ACTN|nr:hypothetical protein SAMN04515671_1870 [Nakamurella panacisegetis]
MDREVGAAVAVVLTVAVGLVLIAAGSPAPVVTPLAGWAGVVDGPADWSARPVPDPAPFDRDSRDVGPVRFVGPVVPEALAGFARDGEGPRLVVTGTLDDVEEARAAGVGSEDRTIGAGSAARDTAALVRVVPPVVPGPAWVVTPQETPNRPTTRRAPTRWRVRTDRRTDKSHTPR